MAAAVYPLLARGVFATYGYFIVDEETGHALLIDPGAQPEFFMQAAAERGWIVEKILLTHGHFDHMGAADALRRAWGAPIYAHYLSPMYLEDPNLNLSASHGMNITLYDTEPLKNGDRIALDAAPDVAVTVLHTPGHTDDSVVYVLDGANIAFVGDTVYEGGPGLTIFPTGDPRKLNESIHEKLFSLPDSTALLSGHSREIPVGMLRRVMARR